MQSYLNDIELKLTRVVERNFRTLRRGLLFSTPSRLFVNMQMRLGESRQLWTNYAYKFQELSHCDLNAINQESNQLLKG